mgnify:CR=1 FL=1
MRSFLVFICHSAKCLGEILKSRFECRPRAGDVDALKAAAARAEDGSVVEPEMRLVDDLFIERLIREPVGTEVEPEEIGSLGFDDLYLRQMCREKTLGTCAILLDVGEQLREPLRAVFVGCLCASKPKCVRLIVARAAQFLLEAVAQLRISDEDVGDLQSREVKGLAR